MEIAIIGAGIGGLTTALALKQIGIKTTIFESASEIKAVGAGIALAGNAMQIFDKLGVRHKIESAGHIIKSIKITDEQMHIVSTSQLEKFEKQYGVYNLAIHRADLHKILADEIGYDNIKLSKRLINIESTEPYQLSFEDGSKYTADAIIGADGINSTIRKHFLEFGKLRDTKQKCWRGVCEVNWKYNYENEAIETWGKGKRFGFIKISTNKIYWYAVANENLVNPSTSLTELFKEFHTDVLEIIKATPESKIIFNELKDLEPIYKWQKGKVCLIGDAAHATTPNMGQGACQAVEDAYTISKLFKQSNDIEEVFKQFEAKRLKKAHFIVNTSWKIGKIAHYENGMAIWLRNKILKVIPESINHKQLEKVFEID